MTVEPLVHEAGQRWRAEDLLAIPDDGMRYEIFDGSLLVSPMPKNIHAFVTEELTARLREHAPPGVRVTCAGMGVNVRGNRSYFIPDIVAVRNADVDPHALGIPSSAALLVVEVLSPSNAGTDLVLKRHEYAVDKIAAYWIVDPDQQTLTELVHDGKLHYVEAAVVKPGEQFTTDHPFPVSFDPAEIFG